jgi:hypothetical protein
MNSGNRFKFIERTAQIEDYRGIKAEDGLLRVEYAFEKEYPKVPYDTRGYTGIYTLLYNGLIGLIRLQSALATRGWFSQVLLEA